MNPLMRYNQPMIEIRERNAVRKVFLLAAVVLVAACGKAPETTEELTKAGERAFVEEDYYQARLYFSEALAKKPSDGRLLYLLGTTYHRELMYDSAVFFLKRADLLYPNDRETNLILHEAGTEARDWEIARSALRVLIETGDSENDHLDELAQLSLLTEDYAYANHYYRKLLEKEPDNPDRYIQVANTWAELGYMKEAIAMTDSAIEVFGPQEQFISNKGLYYAVKTDYEASERIFRSLLSQDSTVRVYQLNLANALASQNDREKKREAYRIYRDLQTVAGAELRIDSMISVLETELGIERPRK